MEHQKFLFSMERINPYEAEVCNKFSTLLDLEGCSGDCISEESQSRESTYKMEHGAEAQSFPLTEVKDMNSRSFEAHAPYLRDAFDRGTKVTQLVEAKLGSEGLSMGQEDAEAEVLKQVVERGEEATTSLEGLSYPKAKRRLERRWTRRSVIMPQRQIYRVRRKGHRCKATDSRAMVPQRRDFRGVIDP
ncbi:hypothetical protein BHM03_00036671 [Ensete ventricosum]|nr:hypothetical protein BHM03_00036671 [Ensete ventricosum]